MEEEHRGLKESFQDMANSGVLGSKALKGGESD